MYHQPWELIPNQIRAEGGREIERFRGLPNPHDTQNGAEAWIGSVTRANGVTPENPNLGCSEVRLPNGSKEFLFEAIYKAPYAVLGEKHLQRFGQELGILIKMLDAKAPFLLQCHPSREAAKALWGSDYGKTECWHVLSVRDDVGEKPYILLGFKPGVTREAFEAAYHEHDMRTLENLCHKIEVQPGETYFIPAGMPHALGSGCFVVEVQEPSDLTAVPIPQSELIAFRHHANPKGVFSAVDNALYEKRMLGSFNFIGYTLSDVLRQTKSTNPVLRKGSWGTEEMLIGQTYTPYFTCTCLNVRGGEAPLSPTDDIRIGLVTRGHGEIVCNSGRLAVRRGSEVFLPFDVAGATLTGDMSIILCSPHGV